MYERWCGGKKKLIVSSVSSLQIGTTIRRCSEFWITASWSPMPSACSSGLCVLWLPDINVVARVCYFCPLKSRHLWLCSQRDLWRAPASAVLPECWNADEWVVHLPVRLRLLLAHPLISVLRLYPGKDTNVRTFFCPPDFRLTEKRGSAEIR